MLVYRTVKLEIEAPASIRTMSYPWLVFQPGACYYIVKWKLGQYTNIYNLLN